MNRAVLGGILGTAVTIAALALLSSLHPPASPPAPFTTVEDARQMLSAAQGRDPFACGAGLHILVDHPEEVRLRAAYFGACCCCPPVSDLAGHVGHDCHKILTAP